MKESEFAFKLIRLLSDHMVTAITGLLRDIIPAGRTSIVIDTDCTEDIDNVYVPVGVNDSGEYAYFRGEQITEYHMTEDGFSIKTECGSVISNASLDAETLHGIIRNLEDIKERLDDETFAFDGNILVLRDEEWEQ